MHALSVSIERYVDDAFPGFVQCVLVDANGRPHRFIEKAPMVSSEHLSARSSYPQPGRIACVVEHAWAGVDGRKLVLASTTDPWDIVSLGGESKFTVLREQIANSER